MSDVYDSITRARVIIAELTGRNPNVFYELGIAHEQAKAVVQITQSIDDVPFDVRHLRTVVYGWGAEANVARLAEDLDRHLRKALLP
jgi:hypothetical protein